MRIHTTVVRQTAFTSVRRCTSTSSRASPQIITDNCWSVLTRETSREWSAFCWPNYRGLVAGWRVPATQQIRYIFGDLASGRHRSFDRSLARQSSFARSLVTAVGRRSCVARLDVGCYVNASRWLGIARWVACIEMDNISYTCCETRFVGATI